MPGCRPGVWKEAETVAAMGRDLCGLGGCVLWRAGGDVSADRMGPSQKYQKLRAGGFHVEPEPGMGGLERAQWGGE